MIQQSAGFKEAAVQKYHQRGSKTVSAVAREIRISDSCLYAWVSQYGTSPGMKKADRRPQDWEAAEKFKAVVEYEGLVAEKRGEYLRHSGLHSENIEAWKKGMQAGLTPATRSQSERAEMSELKAALKELKRDLHRKDRALAETTALLVLKKKPT